jgi:hypothetical protein
MGHGGSSCGAGGQETGVRVSRTPCYSVRGGEDALRSSGGTVGGDLVLDAGFLGEARAVVVATVEKKVLVRAVAVLVKFPKSCWDGQISTSTGSGTAGRGRSNQCQSRH